MAKPIVNVGIIGGGLMGREIAAAFGRWPALVDPPVDVRLTAVCDVVPAAMDWFDRMGTVVTKVPDYHDLLSDDSIDVLYVAVRHDLHEQIYVDAIEAGKDLLVEKPFGIDLAAAERICAALGRHPDVFVRCSSELPFYPGAQRAFDVLQSGEIGPLIEATNTFSHSSDLDLDKPVNWKRQVATCGEAGVMNDLGMHVAHVPFRLGWVPTAVYAVLQDLVSERPGPDGNLVPCDTIENATLLCTVEQGSRTFPLHLATKRIDPGQQNTWTLRATGLGGGVEFSTRYPKTLRRMEVRRGQQVWQEEETGSQSVFPTVTGAIFEPGFSDTILQMWAAYLAERAGILGSRFGCVTPEEALASHRLWSAALKSAVTGSAVEPGIKLP
jgi:predicted dehydrogenase